MSRLSAHIYIPNMHQNAGFGLQNFQIFRGLNLRTPSREGAYPSLHPPPEWPAAAHGGALCPSLRSLSPGQLRGDATWPYGDGRP
jgi:hypothetical protein